MSGKAGVFEGLDTVLIRGSNIDAARTCYRERLELTDKYLDAAERLAVFDLAGASLTLCKLKQRKVLPPPRFAVPFPIISVSDAPKTWALLLESGLAVGELVDAGGVTFFTFTDPDGNLLKACQVY